MDDTNVRSNVTVAFAEFIANYAPKKFRGRGYPYYRKCLSVAYFYERFRSVFNRNTPKSLLALYRYCPLTRSAKRELPLCNTCFPTYVLISRDFNVLFFFSFIFNSRPPALGQAFQALHPGPCHKFNLHI